jgi:hypothetical protein
MRFIDLEAVLPDVRHLLDGLQAAHAEVMAEPDAKRRATLIIDTSRDGRRSAKPLRRRRTANVGTPSARIPVRTTTSITSDRSSALRRSATTPGTIGLHSIGEICASAVSMLIGRGVCPAPK